MLALNMISSRSCREEETLEVLMFKMISSAAAVVVLMPLIWISSAVWATGLAAGLAAQEIKRRLKR